jgi:hypothetical protein
MMLEKLWSMSLWTADHQKGNRGDGMTTRIQKIVSGCQTGADIAALDFAIERGIPHGDWCPRGRKAEDGPINSRYNLQETPSSNYLQRTEWNVRDSDGTVIFSIAPVLTGGSQKTVELAHKHHKPVIHIARDGGPASPAQVLLRFIQDNKIKMLNVIRAASEQGAGGRGPGLSHATVDFLGAHAHPNFQYVGFEDGSRVPVWIACRQPAWGARRIAGPLEPTFDRGSVCPGVVPVPLHRRELVIRLGGRHAQ